MVGGCNKKEGKQLNKWDWMSEEVTVWKKASAALLTYAHPKTLLCDAMLSQSVTQ